MVDHLSLELLAISIIDGDAERREAAASLWAEQDAIIAARIAELADDQS
jgi:hypothetical protein